MSASKAMLMARKSLYVLDLTPEQSLVLESRARQYALPYPDVVCEPRSCSWRRLGWGNYKTGARLDTRREVVSK